MTAITHLSADTTSDEVVATIQAEGGVIVDNLLPPETVAAIQAELNPYLSAGKKGREAFGGFETKRIGALMARSPECRDLAVHPLINASAAQLLEPFCDSHQLHFTQAVSICKGEGKQPIHRDRAVWGNYLDYSKETQFSTIWAMTDFTKKNGATQFIPGSHLWDTKRRPLPGEVVKAEMTAGSVLLYNGTVFHRGGSNETEDNRTGVLIYYTLNWLRQEENQYLSCPPNQAKDLTPELRRLMGHARGGPVLGFYSTPGAPGEGFELSSP